MFTPPVQILCLYPNSGSQFLDLDFWIIVSGSQFPIALSGSRFLDHDLWMAVSVGVGIEKKAKYLAYFSQKVRDRKGSQVLGLLFYKE